MLDLCTDIHNTQQHLQDHCLALDQRVHQLAQQIDSWPEQLATALTQIQQKQMLQQTSAGLRTTGGLGRLGARNSIAVGRSTADETLINKMAQAAVQGLNQPFNPLASTDQPCCLARKASLIPGDIQLGRGDQQICHCHALHQLHAYQTNSSGEPVNLNLQQQQQQQATGRLFDRQSNAFLHPNDAASLAANRPSWSASNLANTNLNVAANQNLNPNAANSKLLALFVPRAGSLDA